MKKHLEGLSGSAIKRLLAKASVIPLEDLMDADEVEVSINSNIEADLIEAVKENIENKKFAGRKDVEEEVGSSLVPHETITLTYSYTGRI